MMSMSGSWISKSTKNLVPFNFSFWFSLFWLPPTKTKIPIDIFFTINQEQQEQQEVFNDDYLVLYSSLWATPWWQILTQSFAPIWKSFYFWFSFYINFKHEFHLIHIRIRIRNHYQFNINFNINFEIKIIFNFVFF